MSKLVYEKIPDVKEVKSLDVYSIDTLYKNEEVSKIFRAVKANVCDINAAFVIKCIQGHDQDFIVLMDKAKDFIESTYQGLERAYVDIVLQMFKEAVFGYYVLTPLIADKTVSDIKVYSWNHITCKVRGKRLLSDITFYDEDDYKSWIERLMRIHRLSRGDENALIQFCDRRGVADFYLRIDMQLPCITSTEKFNLHIRKTPKEKYGFEYLINNDMLSEEMLEYIKNRIAAGCSFLLSGRGGSGKTTLLNEMLDILPFDESVLVSQDWDELYSNKHPQIQFEHTMEIKREDFSVMYTLEDELRLGLIQDIDNLVVGEIKGGEALYVFTTAMSTGARFFGTIHSNNAAGSLTRLAQCARYISDYPMETLLEMISDTRTCLVHMSAFSIDEIVEVAGWNDNEKRLVLKTVYWKDYVYDTFEEV